MSFPRDNNHRRSADASPHPYVFALIGGYITLLVISGAAEFVTGNR
jgi:hypothetical protein